MPTAAPSKEIGGLSYCTYGGVTGFWSQPGGRSRSTDAGCHLGQIDRIGDVEQVERDDPPRPNRRHSTILAFGHLVIVVRRRRPPDRAACARRRCERRAGCLLGVP